MGKPRRPLSERFWERVAVRDEADCWEWTGYRVAAGYGRIGSGGNESRPLYAHRLSYAMAHGPIPDGLDVLHRCDNPPCVNPGHLFVGTQADNGADMVAKGRSYRGPTWSTKPREVRAAAIAAYVAGDGSYADIARRFNVCPNTVWRWLRDEGIPRCRLSK